METPLSSRRRGPRWCMETRRLDMRNDGTPKRSNSTGTTMSSPSITPRNSSLVGRQMDFEDEDFDDDIMPSTQAFGRNEQDVYWDYEASPNTRAELSRKMAETDGGSDDEKKTTLTRSASRNKSQKVKPPTPIVKLKQTTSRRLQINQNMFSDQDFLMMQQLGEQIEHETGTEKASSKSPEDVSKINNKLDESDPFSEDDSFLIQCSQALDENELKSSTKSPQPSSSTSTQRSLDSNSNHEFRKPEVAKKFTSLAATSSTSSTAAGVPKMTSSSSTQGSANSSKMSTNNDSPSTVFDDDDAEEFEMLLSQIDIPEDSTSSRSASSATSVSTNKTIGESANPKKASASLPKPVINPSSQNSAVSVNSSTPFKRFKSADDAAQKKTYGHSASTTTIASRPTQQASSTATARSSSNFRRVNSLPDTPPGPLPGGRQAVAKVTPKCSKEEIERKRQEALKRRLLNSQKPMTSSTQQQQQR